MEEEHIEEENVETRKDNENYVCMQMIICMYAEDKGGREEPVVKRRRR
jgi:hypothetical protein